MIPIHRVWAGKWPQTRDEAVQWFLDQGLHAAPCDDIRPGGFLVWLDEKLANGIPLREHQVCVWPDGDRWLIDDGWTPGKLIERTGLRHTVLTVCWRLSAAIRVDARATVAERHNETQRIATALGETEQEPITLIGRVVRDVSLDFANEVLRATDEVEAQGGMLVKDGSRRRTKGGVFFQLARARMNRWQQFCVFARPTKVEMKRRAEREAARAAQAEAEAEAKAAEATKAAVEAAKAAVEAVEAAKAAKAQVQPATRSPMVEYRRKRNTS